MEKLIIVCMVVASLLTSCNSNKTPEKIETKDDVHVLVGEYQYEALSHLIMQAGRKDWPSGTSYFRDNSEPEYRFIDSEGNLHAMQIQNEGIIMAVIILKNTNSLGHNLAYVIEKDRAVVWITDMPSTFLTEKQAIEIVKADYNDLLIKATE